MGTKTHGHIFKIIGNKLYILYGFSNMKTESLLGNTHVRILAAWKIIGRVGEFPTNVKKYIYILIDTSFNILFLSLQTVILLFILLCI